MASSSSSSSLWESIMQRHKRLTGGQSYSWSEHPVCLLQQKPLCYFIQMRRNKCRSAGLDCSFGKIPFVFQQAPASIARFILIYRAAPSSLTKHLIKKAVCQYTEVFSSTIYSPRIESVTALSSHKFGSTGYI